jgi:hypothetical protein
MCCDVSVGSDAVAGRAVPLYEPIVTPFTQRAAVWFSWELERWDRSGGHREWTTVERRETAAPFWIEDDTGRVLVRPRGGILEPHEVLCEQIGSEFAPPYSRAQLREWVLIGEDVEERRRSMADPAPRATSPAGETRLADSSDADVPLDRLPGRHRITEQLIAADTTVYVFGTVRVRGDAEHALEFSGEDLRVSTRPR